MMAKRVSKHHYVATPRPGTPPSIPHHHSLMTMSSSTSYRNNPAYSTDGEDSQRGGASDRMMSEYIVVNERTGVMPPPRKHKSKQRSKSEERRSTRSFQPQYNTDHEGSDIYITSGAYRAPSEISRGSRYSRGARSTHSRAPSHYSVHAPSEVSTIKTKVDKKRGVVVETMSAPNPFCPHTKGMCCLMLLLNLGLILVTLGFVIVIQFFEPVFVWILGIVFLIFGFLTLIGSLIYCVTICREVKSPSQVAMEDHYWTRHWQKGFGTVPEIHYTTQDKY